MGVMLPNYLDLNSVQYFIESNILNIDKLPNSRIRNAFKELKFAIEEYQQEQVERQEREQLAKLKAKYENTKSFDGERGLFDFILK